MSLINALSLLPPPTLFYTLCSGSKEMSTYCLPGSGIIAHPTVYKLESPSPRRRIAQNAKHPVFVFLLQGSGVDDRRRTLTPLALRYSILSESTQGINLFVMICAPSLPKELVSELASPHPDKSSM